MNALRQILVCSVSMVALASPVRATDVYVDAVNGSFANSGLSLGAAKLTISQGVALAKSLGGARVRIQEGTYDEALGEDFPIELDHDDVELYGDEVNRANWPRIGGDVNDSNVSALVLIDASGDDLEDVSLYRLHFLGENTATKDAPSALEVIVGGTYTLNRVGVLDCVFERSEMNASQAAGRATIRVGIQGAGSFPFAIRDSEIWASRKGGIEVNLEEVIAEGNGIATVTVEGCSILIEGTDDAEFGIFCGGGEGFHGSVELKLSDTIIDSTGVTTEEDGIETGIDIWLDASDGNLVRLHDDNSAIVRCTIKGCKGDGIRIRLNEEEESIASVAFQGGSVFGNQIHNNGGAGVHLMWNEENGYIRFNSENSLYADNEYGIWYDGFTETISGQTGNFVNDTIANNDSFGLRFDGTFEASGTAPSPALLNVIVWGNNSGNAQSGGDDDGATWDPVVDGSMAYSNWQGLPNADCSTADSNHNIDCLPVFVNAGAGDYHLGSTSPCIDAGNSFPPNGLPRADIDGEDRTQDGDGLGGDEVDMGIDEYSP